MELRDFSKEYFDLEKNNKFVLLKEDPKFEIAIQNFELPFMNRIGLEKKKQFGIEMEFLYADLNKIAREIALWKNKVPDIPTVDWIAKPDTTINNLADMSEGNLYGGEVASPIFHDQKEDWLEVRTVCDIIKKLGGHISWECGLHIHIDFQKLNLTKEQMWNLLMIWYRYEDVLYGFAKGEVSKVRDGVMLHARSIRPTLNRWFFSNSLDNFYNPLGKSDFIGGKEFGLDLKDYQKYVMGKEIERTTIEFRIGNSTLSPNIIQNYVRLYSYILTKAQSVESKLGFDKILSDANINQENIDIDKACEFADFIFDNNLDKFCFMKQYVKVK